MGSQVSFTADPVLKKMALEKAKREGVNLKTVLVYSMKAYVEDKIRFGMVDEHEPDVEEIYFSDSKIEENAAKLAKLLS